MSLHSEQKNQDFISENTIPDSKEENSFNSLYLINKWDDLEDIDSDILRGIYSYGYEGPSPIQSKGILPILKGHDVIAQAQSGTGKTATFCIGVLGRINTQQDAVQAIILSPTHELTTQTATVIRGLGAMMKGLKIQTIMGGSSIDHDIEAMRYSSPHIIVGCPGRTFDMIRRKHISTSHLKVIVLDEADEMFCASFKEQMYSIFQYLDNKVQVVLFSATLPPNIFEITNKIMNNPYKIRVDAEKLTLEGIKQYYIAIEDDEQKYATIKELYQVLSLSQCIIYCNSRRRVADLWEAMKQDNFPVTCIHSGMEKNERDQNFTDFKTGVARVLISSDITARGIDIQQVSVVINFDVPKDVHTYIHRIGRSGRWGRKGTGINFVTRRDRFRIRDIESYYHTQIDELPASFVNIV
jgi:superfamily II DNA/RNA helicase